MGASQTVGGCQSGPGGREIGRKMREEKIASGKEELCPHGICRGAVNPIQLHTAPYIAGNNNNNDISLSCS